MTISETHYADATYSISETNYEERRYERQQVEELPPPREENGKGRIVDEVR